MTKHVEKVEEVKKEVGFFNSYLKVSKILYKYLSSQFINIRVSGSQEASVA